MLWYYIKDGQRLGPIEDDEIAGMVRDGRLNPDNLVWNETMGEEWAEVRSVAGLAQRDGAAAAPALPGEAPPPLPGQEDEPDDDLPQAISCTVPVNTAWERMKTMLFRPFDMGKWFTLGFSAWLATLGQNGGGAGNFRGVGDLLNEAKGGEANAGLEKVKEFYSAHAAIIGVVVVVAVVLMVVLGLLFLWLRCRGQFMFLDNMVHNRAQVKEPWERTKHYGDSLFKWNIVFALICFAIFLLLAAGAGFGVALPWVKAHHFVMATVPVIVLLSVLGLAYVLVTACIGVLRDDFVVPLMYRFDLTATQGWARFMPLFRSHRGDFILYLLFRFLLLIAAQACIVVFILITCCIGGCVLSIPYVGIVLALPVPVFFQAYALDYLRQFGKDYKLFMWR